MKFRVSFRGKFRNKFREKQKQMRNVAKGANGPGEACRLDSRRRNPSESTDRQELRCPNLSNFGFVSFEGWILDLAMHTENLVGFPSPFHQRVRAADACPRNLLWPPPASAVPAALLGELDDHCAVSSLKQRERLKVLGGGSDEHSLEHCLIFCPLIARACIVLQKGLA